MEEKNKIESTESDIVGDKIVEKQNINKQSVSDEKKTVIITGRIDSWKSYEVKEEELETIEKGSPTATYFNISIALLTTAISFLTTLILVDLSSRPKVFIIFSLLTIVGFIVGGILLLLWSQTKNDVKIVCKKIRDRIKEV